VEEELKLTMEDMEPRRQAYPLKSGEIGEGTERMACQETAARQGTQKALVTGLLPW